MEVVTEHFDNPVHAVEWMHAHFRHLEEEHPPAAPPRGCLHRARLALHEWLSNLSRHADFERRTPDLLIHLTLTPERICCVVEDNSAGFDLPAQLEGKEHVFEEMPERGMGLQIISACVETLTYTMLRPCQHRFEFHVVAPEDL